MSDFITFTGALIRGTMPELPPPKQLAAICSEAEANGIAPLYYYFLQKHLPEPYQSDFRRKWQGITVFMMKQEFGLQQFFRQLEAEKLRFAPLKGAELAFHAYPDPALRSFGDWDILFHPDDCDRALEFLNRDGWKPEYILPEKLYGHHHYHFATKGIFHIEPHRGFSRFNADPASLWQEIHPVAPGKYQHRLSAELHVLLLLRHASVEEYTHIPYLRLFGDLSFLLQSHAPDPGRLRRLAKMWQLPDPFNLLGAFPEFFIFDIPCNPRKAAAWRELFLSQNEYSGISSQERARNLPGIFSGKWLLSQLRTTADRIDMRRRKEPGKNLLRLTFEEIGRRVSHLPAFLRQTNPAVRSRYQRIMLAEEEE